MDNPDSYFMQNIQCYLIVNLDFIFSNMIQTKVLAFNLRVRDRRYQKTLKESCSTSS